MIGRRPLAVLGLVLAIGGCTRVVDSARPVAQRAVAPITAGQVGDLLSEKAEPDDEPNLFVSVAPQRCAGLAQEVDAPFIFGTTPAAHDGGQHYADVRRSVSVQEIVGVYPAGYNPRAAVDSVRRTITSCRQEVLTVTTMADEELTFRPLPEPESPWPEIVLWSLGGRRACDNAFVAAHNAAVEITACSDRNGYDVSTLAHAALLRINALADMRS